MPPFLCQFEKEQDGSLQPQDCKNSVLVLPSSPSALFKQLAFPKTSNGSSNEYRIDPPPSIFVCAKKSLRERIFLLPKAFTSMVVITSWGETLGASRRGKCRGRSLGTFTKDSEDLFFRTYKTSYRMRPRYPPKFSSNLFLMAGILPGR